MDQIGGQAVVEGIMMISSKKVAVAVRKGDKIKTKVEPRAKIAKAFSRIFFVRGIVALIEMLYLGIRALAYSSNESAGKGEKISTLELVFAFLFSFGLAIVFFILIPLYLSKLITDDRFWFNVVDGILRIGAFVAYVLIISRMKDVQRIFQYHGAEHMAVHCCEAKKKLTIENVGRFSTLHPRCGTSFIFIVLVVSIFVFSVVWAESWWLRFLYRIVLIPVIAGISYEILKISARHRDNGFFRIIVMPGLWFQKITTKRPDRKQIEVGIKALNSVL